MKIQEFKPLKADYNRLKSRSSTIDLRSLRKTDLFKENVSFIGGLGGGFLLAFGKWLINFTPVLYVPNKYKAYDM